MTSRAVAITPAHVDTAKETLILRRDTHLDSLAERLHEARVRRVIEPVLTGSFFGAEVYNDDLLYVAGLGLVTPPPAQIRIANPIYAGKKLGGENLSPRRCDLACASRASARDALGILSQPARLGLSFK